MFAQRHLTFTRVKFGRLTLQVIPDERPLHPELLISAYSGTFYRLLVNGRGRWLRLS